MKKILIGVAIGAAVILLTCIGGFVLLVMAAQPPEGIAVTLEQPDSIAVGDTFDLTLTITNALNREREVYDVDFWSPLLDGVSVVTVTPSYQAYDGMFGIETYTMQHAIPPADELIITFTMQADTAGVYAGDLDVGVDGFLRINTTSHVIRIDP